MTLRGKHLHILIVEDNTGDYILIEEFLKEEVGTPLITRTNTLTETKQLLIGVINPNYTTCRSYTNHCTHWIF